MAEKEEFWDIMKEDFKNLNFNSYDSGPGAGLEDQFHSSQVSSTTNQNRRSKNPYLVFHNVPKSMSLQGLTNLCANFGKVLTARNTPKNSLIFVDFPTVNDMERVFTALQNNQYGFNVSLGKNQPQSSFSEQPSNSKNITDYSSQRNLIDLENRTYKVSSRKPDRPHFVKDNLVSKAQYESKDNLFKKNDPKGFSLLADDTHDLELDISHGNNKYHGGRTYVDMPESSRNYIKEKCRSSEKTFSNEKTFVKSSMNHLEKDLSNLGACDECNLICDSVCARCSTYYCSFDCQKSGWQQHRQVCGKPDHVLEKMRNLKIEQEKKKTPILQTGNLKNDYIEGWIGITEEAKKEIPPNGDTVILTSISKSNMAFIRSNSVATKLLFCKTISDIQKIGRQKQPLQKQPVRGQIVLTQFKEQFNRAMILKQEKDKYSIVYTDFGNIDYKSVHELFEAPEEFITLPRLAVPVILKNVPDVFLTEDLRKFMFPYLNNIEFRVKYDEKTDFLRDKGVFQVELWDEKTNKHFNKEIVTLSQIIYPTNSSKVLYREFLKHLSLPTGDDVELVVMDNSLMLTGCISCTTKHFALRIQHFQAELQQYAEEENKNSYAPRVNELCIAKYDKDQKWYRGRCIELIGDGYPTILFFDYGNTALVSIDDIRLYPMKFSYPVFTADCEIFGLPEEVDENTVKRLEELVTVGSVIQCDNVAVFPEDNFHTIKLNKVMNQLRAEGFVQ